MRAHPQRLILLPLTFGLFLGPLVGGARGQLTPAPPAGGQSSTSATVVPGLTPAAPAVKGRHLDAVPSMAWGGGSARDRMVLILDITPKPGMRVYAPGNKGYTPVQFTIDSIGDYTVAPTQYPKPSIYVFAPLNERVQVFDRMFRLSREVIGRQGRPSANTVTGRLEYQACDDKVCYLPQTLSLSWTVTP